MNGLKHEEIARLHDLLRQKIAQAGRGSLKRVERALGVKPGFFRVSRHRKIINYGAVLAALDEIGADPAEFFAELFGRPSRPARDEPPPAPQASPRTPRPSADVPPPDPALRAWLEEMDTLRYHDAEAAVRGLWERSEAIGELHRAPYLAILGSCYRSLGCVGDAGQCLEMAQELAAGDDLVFGDVLQRRAHIRRDQGRLPEALGLAEQAGGVFARAGAWLRFGETLVDQAGFLLHQEEYARAERALKSARLHVREDSDGPAARLRRTLFAIEQRSILIARWRGDLPEAQRLAMKARELAPDPIARGFAWGLIAELCKDLGRWAQAILAYREALAQMDHSPVESLLVTVDLADALARGGRRREAIAVAESVAGHLGALDESPLARAAVTALWMQARSSRLQADKLRGAREALLQAHREIPRGELARRVRTYRRLIGASVKEVARAAHVSEATVRNVESGSRPSSKVRSALTAWTSSVRPELRVPPVRPA